MAAELEIAIARFEKPIGAKQRIFAARYSASLHDQWDRIEPFVLLETGRRDRPIAQG
jgi:hypothetical protein